MSSSPSTAVAPAWACPEHGAPLEQAGNELRCPHGHAFEVREGIPRFVPPSSYADAFGEQWKRFRLTQLDSYSGLTLSHDRLQRCLGPAWDELDGATLLECGCGAGRFTESLLDQGSHVTSIDLSDAVEANALTFPPGPRHRVAQADIRSLPFAPGGYDVVLCLGVVQHTPNSEETIAALYEHVRPGGWLVIDHYTWNHSSLTRFGNVARKVFKRMPADRTLGATERLVDSLLPTHRRLQRFGKVVSRVSPVLSYYHIYPSLSPELQREWAILDTHDTLTDYYKRHRSAGQVRRALDDLGLVDINVRRDGNGIEGRGRKPA